MTSLLAKHNIGNVCYVCRERKPCHNQNKVEKNSDGEMCNECAKSQVHIRLQAWCDFNRLMPVTEAVPDV